MAGPQKRSTGQVCGTESRGRISGFCFDSSRWCFRVPWVPFRQPENLKRSKRHTLVGPRDSSPLFLGIERSQAEKEKETADQGPYCIIMGITDIRLSGSYPRSYCAIYGRSLVVHTVFRVQDCVILHE